MGIFLKLYTRPRLQEYRIADTDFMYVFLFFTCSQIINAIIYKQMINENNLNYLFNVLVATNAKIKIVFSFIITFYFPKLFQKSN